jgi:hypothetical protein
VLRLQTQTKLASNQFCSRVCLTQRSRTTIDSVSKHSFSKASLILSWKTNRLKSSSSNLTLITNHQILLAIIIQHYSREWKQVPKPQAPSWKVRTAWLLSLLQWIRGNNLQAKPFWSQWCSQSPPQTWLLNLPIKNLMPLPSAVQWLLVCNPLRVQLKVAVQPPMGLPRRVLYRNNQIITISTPTTTIIIVILW